MPGIELVIKDTDGQGSYTLTVERWDKGSIRIKIDRNGTVTGAIINNQDWSQLIKKGEVI